jgi:hypothetical protein
MGRVTREAYAAGKRGADVRIGGKRETSPRSAGGSRHEASRFGELYDRLGHRGMVRLMRSLQASAPRSAEGHRDAGEAPPIVGDVVSRGGTPLDEATRAYFEPRLAGVAPSGAPRIAASAGPGVRVAPADDPLEHEADARAARMLGSAPAPDRERGPRAPLDLSAVRVHTDEQADASARAVGAQAYTFGNHVVFRSGQYAPNTPAGRQLLAHELAHVAQQADGASGVERRVQRSLTVVDAANAPPATAGTRLATNAALVESWLGQLCGSGGWHVDAATGVVSTPNRATVCAAGATSSTPTSCKCLCDATAPGSADVRIRVGDSFTVGQEHVDVVAAGQGATLNPDTSAHRHETNIGISNRSSTQPGAGDTSPVSGSGHAQRIRDPAWLIFAHELCGHQQTGTSGHYQTPGGTDTTAVDVENRIRREHSTTTASLGIRKGEFRADEDATQQNNIVYQGSLVTPLASESLVALARRLGIGRARIPGHIFALSGDWIPANEVTTFSPSGGVFAVNVFHHDVIASETLPSIATMWGVPAASIVRANGLTSRTVAAGQHLIIPAS